MERYKRHVACGCNERYMRNTNPPMDNSIPLAMPVMPVQEFRDLYEPCEALEKGTLFIKLYKPYCIRGGCR